MDVVGFLDALCWGNSPASVDPLTKSSRTNLMHSERLAMVVSRWLCPLRTSQGGSRAEGARRTLMPVIIGTVKGIINEEMDVVVEGLYDDSAEVAEKSVHGTAIGEVQEKVQVAAPVFCDLERTAAWSKKQEKRNKLKDPTTVSIYCEFEVAVSHSDEPLAHYVYFLSGGIFVESSHKQDASPVLPLPEGLWYCGGSL